MKDSYKNIYTEDERRAVINSAARSGNIKDVLEAYETTNPSVRNREEHENENERTAYKLLGRTEEPESITLVKTGTDFMTNQPKYGLRGTSKRFAVNESLHKGYIGNEAQFTGMLREASTPNVGVDDKTSNFYLELKGFFLGNPIPHMKVEAYPVGNPNQRYVFKADEGGVVKGNLPKGKYNIFIDGKK